MESLYEETDDLLSNLRANVNAENFNIKNKAILTNRKLKYLLKYLQYEYMNHHIECGQIAQTQIVGEGRSYTTIVNCKTALKVLKEMYQNTRLSFTSLVDQIFDIMDSDSAVSIKQMLDTTKNNMQVLKGLKIPTKDVE